MNGDAFTKHIAVADLQSRDAAFPFQVLRLLADAGEREDFVFLAELGVAVNDDMRMKQAIIPECDVSTDDAIRADFAARTDLGFGMNDGRCVDHGEIYELRYTIYALVGH